MQLAGTRVFRHIFIRERLRPLAASWLTLGMAAAKCSQCVALDVPEDEMGPVEDECRICGDWSCEWHGHEYRTGYEHEACHESPDFSRIEE